MLSEMVEVVRANVYIGALLVLAGTLVLAVVLDLGVIRPLLKLARRTKTVLDDQLLSVARRPVFFTVLLVGLHEALSRLPMSDSLGWSSRAVLITVGVLLWTLALAKSGKILLEKLALSHDERAVLQPTTLPLFNLAGKIVIYGGAAYGLFLAWEVNVTAWLASAGIVGLAVGFAAKDTLSNLFAGIFIMADGPYRIGDFIILGSGERGRVTDIGMRTTRILTRDDVEIVIPNSLMGNSMVVNETAGPYPKERVRVDVGVAYGSDIDHVRRVLLDVAAESDNVVDDPSPRVRLRALGESSLDFQLLGWIDEPVLRGRTIDELLTLIYKRFNEEGIKIPFPQRDVWLQNPDSSKPDPEIS